MKLKLLIVVLCFTVGSQSTPAKAQFGRLVKEGLEAAGKKALGKTASKASQAGAEELLKKGSSATLRVVGRESAEAAAKRTGLVVLGHTDDAVKAVAKHGSAIATPLVSSFGDDGAKALMNLSSTNARRMAIVADELAAGGRGADWMRVLAEKGDLAAEWVWSRKGTLALATVATAFLANPEPFLQAGEQVATTAIETAGEHVARPLIEQTIGTVAPQVATQIATTITKPAVAMADATSRHPWLGVVFLAVFCGGGFLAYRRYLRPML
ncbi:MAG: hypothetical protein IAG10_15300 [Planctomycetaceae bacterium]|nr:hypothetical protein [Planctomycetaceae bacterium]